MLYHSPTSSAQNLSLIHISSELIPLIDRFPVCELKPEPQEKYFGTLVTGIVSQQLPPDVSLQLLKNLGKFLSLIHILTEPKIENVLNSF